jgi:RNA polymerase sigma factor, sigma-70 family
MFVDVIGGFLGSGKTTAILHLLRDPQHAGGRTVLLVNEFGQVGVDGALLAGQGGQVKELASGCICCSLKADFIGQIEEIARDLDLTVDEVEQIRRSAQTPVSLEKPVGDEEESEFGHFLTNLNDPLPDEAAETTMRRETLDRILSKLAPRERRVLELRYGLDGEHPRTLDEVGRTFNVTRERIRQIENQSLKKLRALADSHSLRDVA